MEPRNVFSLILPIAILLLIDVYAFQSFRTAFQNSNYKNIFNGLFWVINILTLLFIGVYMLKGHKRLPHTFNTFMFAFVFITLLSNVVIVLFMLGEDITRIVRWGIAKLASPDSPAAIDGISRSEFLSKAAIITAAVPFGTLLYGMIANPYNYQYRRVSVRFPNLPDAFNGFRIIQLSDIHSGSFTRTQPLEDAVAHINSMNADIILFTGDLVNNISDEMDPYMHIFDKLRAKRGVLSTTGNHDYGDYVEWDSIDDKRANFQKFMNIHKQLGWDLLMNENRILEKDGQKIAIIGIENWGGGRFKKYGKLDKAYVGTENIPFKLLMSHDPSHWDMQVRPDYPNIDLVLAGHTHGAQFGVENKWLKWSPSQWVYKQWAGLYQEGKQYIYVNRGFGFLGYPGRVGILPEVTEITLLKG